MITPLAGTLHILAHKTKLFAFDNKWFKTTTGIFYTIRNWSLETLHMGFMWEK